VTLIDAATKVLRAVGKNPGRFRALVKMLNPEDRREATGPDHPAAPTVLFEPLRATDDYPLWIRYSGSIEAEWWLDDRPLTDWQASAVKAACQFQPIPACMPSGLDYRRVRVFETLGCLEFVSPGAEAWDAHGTPLRIEDTVIAVDKPTLKASGVCRESAKP
jgi:hypothetical protein